MAAGAAGSDGAEVLAALGDIALLIRRARDTLASAGLADETVRGETVAYLDRAEEHVTAAATQAVSRYRRLDGRLSLRGAVVQEWPVALVAGLAAYTARLVLDLSAATTVLVVVAVLLIAAAVQRPILRTTADRDKRRLLSQWPGVLASETQPGDVGLPVILQARRSIHALATARLGAPRGLTGAEVVAAGGRDAVSWHLRRADLRLCQGYSLASQQLDGGAA